MNFLTKSFYSNLIITASVDIMEFYSHENFMKLPWNEINFFSSKSNRSLSWFHDNFKRKWIFILRSFSHLWDCYWHTVWILQNFTPIENIFCAVIYLVTSLVKTLLSRDFCQKCIFWRRVDFLIIYIKSDVTKYVHSMAIFLQNFIFMTFQPKFREI